MDPTQRDEDAENLIASFIRGPGGAPDVTEFLNNSGEGDPELARRDGSGEVDPELARRDGSGEGEAYDIVEGDDDGEADGSHEREADGSGRTLDITNSGEVHIYMLIK
jgi:hypothetical protein